MSDSPRKIVHVDMDAFYASVEQRDRPELRGRPVIVGGPARGRGVVATASYEAREFGVHSAMPSAQAARLCPHGVFLPPDFAKYKQVSTRIRAIFRRYTPLVEPLSLDEAYLDVSDDLLGIGSATLAAQAILAEIRAETGLSASAGAAPNKFLAKVASDLDKPGGLVVIPPERVEAFVRGLPVRKIPGVGAVGERRLTERGIRTCADVLRYDEAELEAWFGSWGLRLARLARGIDPRPVVPERGRKSCSVEDTFARDLLGEGPARRELERLAETLARRLERAGVVGRTVTLKVKYADFEQITRSRTHERALGSAAALLATVTGLLDQTEVATRPVRLLGIGVSHLDEPAARQLVFSFYDDAPGSHA